MAIYSKCYLIKNQTVITSDSRLNIMTNVKSTEAHTTYHKTILSQTKNYQSALEPASYFLSTYALPVTKFPAKITGNFSEHIRELSANNRELIHYFFGKSTRPLGVFKIASIQDFA